MKNQAREKKIKKAEKIFNHQKDSEIMKLTDINNKRIRQKLQKKNLFDLESDDEAMDDLKFYANREMDIEKNEGFV